MKNLLENADSINRRLARCGVKFSIYKNGAFNERLFPFDAIPRIIQAAQLADAVYRHMECTPGVSCMSTTAAEVYVDGMWTGVGPTRNQLLGGRTMYAFVQAGIFRTALWSGVLCSAVPQYLDARM